MANVDLAAGIFAIACGLSISSCEKQSPHGSRDASDVVQAIEVIDGGGAFVETSSIDGLRAPMDKPPDGWKVIAGIYHETYEYEFQGWVLHPGGESIFVIGYDGFLYERPVSGPGGRVIRVDGPKSQGGYPIYDDPVVSPDGRFLIAIKYTDIPELRHGKPTFFRVVDLESGQPVGDWALLKRDGEILWMREGFVALDVDGEARLAVWEHDRDVPLASQSVLLFAPGESEVVATYALGEPPSLPWHHAYLKQARFEGVLVEHEPTRFLHVPDPGFRADTAIVDERDQTAFTIPGAPYDTVWFSADGQRVIATAAATVDVWELATEKRSARIRPRGSSRQEVLSVAMSTDEKTIVFRYPNAVFEVFDAPNWPGRLVRVVAPRDVFRDAEFTDDGIVAVTDHDIVWFAGVPSVEIARQNAGSIGATEKQYDSDSRDLVDGPAHFQRVSVLEGNVVQVNWHDGQAAVSPDGLVPEESAPSAREPEHVVHGVDSLKKLVLRPAGATEGITIASYEELEVGEVRGCAAHDRGEKIFVWCVRPRAYLLEYDRQSEQTRRIALAYFGRVGDVDADGAAALLVTNSGAIVRVPL